MNKLTQEKQNNAIKNIQSYYSLQILFKMGLNKINLHDLKELEISSSFYISFEYLIMKLKLSLKVIINNNQYQVVTSKFNEKNNSLEIKEVFTTGTIYKMTYFFDKNDNIIRKERCSTASNSIDSIRYDYNKDGKKIKEDGWFGKTTYIYNKNKKLKESISDKGIRKQYFYNNKNQLTSTNINGFVTEYKYSKKGNLIEIKNNFEKISYFDNKTNNIKKKRTIFKKDEYYFYDENDILTGVNELNDPIFYKITMRG